MYKLLSLALAAVALAASSSTAHSTPVTWTFIETSCALDAGFGPCPQVLSPAPGVPPMPILTLPYPLVELTLPGPTSSGSASFSPGGIIFPGQAPVVGGDGDNFSLLINGQPPYSLSSSTLLGNVVVPAGPGSGFPPGTLLTNIEFYDISWTETNGQLNGVSIQYDAFLRATDVPPQISIYRLGLTTGLAGADLSFAGCFDSTCDFTGFWQSNLAVPEPKSVGLLVIGLLSLAIARRLLAGLRGTS